MQTATVLDEVSTSRPLRVIANEFASQQSICMQSKQVIKKGKRLYMYIYIYILIYLDIEKDVTYK